jgi:hypothetical protein
MATKKKTKQNSKKRTASKKAASKKKLANKKAAPRKAAAKTKPRKKQKPVRKAADRLKKRVRGKSQSVNTVSYAPEGLASRVGGQSGDLQGLSNLEGANSESVDELLEEGNAFEAEAVKGVEDAGDADEGEVRTHEVPEDDVPGEYLDKE